MSPNSRELWLQFVLAATRAGIPAKYAAEGADELLRAMEERFGGDREIDRAARSIAIERERDTLKGMLDEAKRELADWRVQRIKLKGGEP